MIIKYEETRGLTNMKKIIFIEPINILNSPNYREKLVKLNNGRVSEMMQEDMQGNKIKLLKELMEETGAEIIICSDWRTCSSKMKGLLDALSKFDITPEHGIHSFMPFSERGVSKTESMARHRRLLHSKDLDTKIVAIDSKLNPGHMEGQEVFYALDELEGMTLELKDFVVSCLGKTLDK